MKIINICGARPNFMKIAPLMRAFRDAGGIEPLLVHTGQHYDENMSRLFFEELEIPRPDINLEVGSGSHARQTAAIMERFEPVVLEQKPDAVLVVGDVNSTIACAMVAVKLGVEVYHVEAGLRSFDRTMPEEINRVLTDAISHLLFVSEPAGLENLKREGVPDERVHFVGNVMIDTLENNRAKAEASRILDQLQLARGQYVVVTMHRPASVDHPEVMEDLLAVFDQIQKELPIVFPMHPRTRVMLGKTPLLTRLESMPKMHLIDPVGYLDFLKLMSEAALVLTDSGGIQEETTILDVPCLTMRDNTERPVTVEQGTNQLVGLRPERILAAWRDLRAGRAAGGRRPEKWDGHAAERIAATILDHAS